MKVFLLIAAIIIIFGSCTQLYYAPNTPNSPLLSQKGEVRLNGNYAAGLSPVNQYSGAEFQGATAVSKHAGIMMNTMFIGGTDYWGKCNLSYAELAGGLFKPLDSKEQWIGEIYGGFGFGSSNNTYYDGNTDRVGTTKIFVQPAIGLKADYFEFSFVPRISYVNLKIKESDFSNPDGFEDRWRLDQIRQFPNKVCFEPALIGRVGGKNVKLQAGLAYSSLSASVFPGYGYEVTGSVGVSVNLAPKKK